MTNHGKPWSDDEVQILTEMWQQKACPFDIAHRLGRSHYSIRGAAVKYGLHQPDKKAAIRERAVRRMLATKAAQEAPAQITLAGPSWSWPEPKRVSL